jgi:hypothetical protein
LEPNPTYGNVVVDHFYTVSWTDWDVDSNATVDFYLDTNRSAGGEIALATGTVMEDDPLDYYVLDLSAIRRELLRQLRLSDDAGDEYRYWSSADSSSSHGLSAVLADDSALRRCGGRSRTSLEGRRYSTATRRSRLPLQAESYTQT